MLIEIFLFLLLGILAGTITGLTPGIHINLVGAILISLSAGALINLNPILLVTLITSMAITHTFVDFIPSIFLGCPDSDTELSILPGHQLLKEGKGYEGILLTIYGGIAAIIILVLTFWPSIILFKNLYPLIKQIIPYLLILTLIVLIFLEKKKISAIIVLLLTGILGYIMLNFEILKEPLLPLLSGLFGSSMLIMSIKNKTTIPEQIITVPKVNLKKPLLGATIASPLCSFLPGLGSGQAAVIGNLISKQDQRGFLVLLGATNTLVMGFSFLALFAISKTRSGAAVAIEQIATNLNTPLLILIVFTILISGIIAFFLTKKIAKFLSKKMQKINYTKLTIFILIFLTILMPIISGWLGLIFFIISTITGIYCINLEVRRTNMMGCLLLPVILFYLFG